MSLNCFVNQYINGRTPNPCVKCNSMIKWDALIKFGSEIGSLLETSNKDLVEAKFKKMNSLITNYNFLNFTIPEFINEILPSINVRSANFRISALDLNLAKYQSDKNFC